MSITPKQLARVVQLVETAQATLNEIPLHEVSVPIAGTIGQAVDALYSIADILRDTGVDPIEELDFNKDNVIYTDGTASEYGEQIDDELDD